MTGNWSRAVLAVAMAVPIGAISYLTVVPRHWQWALGAAAVAALAAWLGLTALSERDSAQPVGVAVVAVVTLVAGVGTAGIARASGANHTVHSEPAEVATAPARPLSPEEAVADALRIPGIVHEEIATREHAEGTVKYDRSPPIGGQHAPVWADCSGTAYDKPIRNENAVHALEHGAAWITVAPDLGAADLARLRAVVVGKDYTLMSPYPGLRTPVSLQAWGFQLALSTVDMTLVNRFLRDLRDNPSNAPEPHGVCSNPDFLPDAAKIPTTTYPKDRTAARSTSGPCRYAETAALLASPYTKDAGLPPDPAPPRSGSAQWTLHTNQGDIAVTLNLSAAPCNAQSLIFLTQQGFFNGTYCHRLTTAASLSVLQCGDPSGTGRGGPTYAVKDEALAGATYPAGTVAMANAGPGTGGSQFFLAYRDCQLPPSYTPVGKVSSGLDVLTRIGAAGSDDADGPGDGHPKLLTRIDSAANG